MKVTDYIVEFFEKQGIHDFFGYQGTMIAHLVDSICKKETVRNHMCYHEQGAAFAGCGYAKVSGECAMVYATSGPGAVNLLSGVADAYYDSTPVVFITGQLNSYEYTEVAQLRQQGFQETNVVAMAKPVTKYAVQVTAAKDVERELEKAYTIASSGRKGPVLIDLPMDIQKQDMTPTHTIEKLKAGSDFQAGVEESTAAKSILKQITEAKAPVLLLGRGVCEEPSFRPHTRALVEKLGIPVITSLPARDMLPGRHPLNFGHLGAAYGHRYANLILMKKTDLIVSLGCSMCRRQTGQKTENFASQAHIVRVDLDPIELRRKVHREEEDICLDARGVIQAMNAADYTPIHGQWLSKCQGWREKLVAFDSDCPERYPNEFIKQISSWLPEQMAVYGDVGQHQIWLSQSFEVREGQRLAFSGGHGAMGFALPAAIGGHYATARPTACFCGDGAFQMNIQELQWVAREQVPVLMVVLNNQSLGLIQQQQDDFFEKNHFGSTEDGGYTSPDFARIGDAYGIPSCSVSSPEEAVGYLKKMDFQKPFLMQIELSVDSRAYPKTYFGEEMYNQKPYMSRELMEEILGE